MRTLYEMRSNAASSGTGCTSCSVEELNAVNDELKQLRAKVKPDAPEVTYQTRVVVEKGALVIWRRIARAFRYMFVKRLAIDPSQYRHSGETFGQTKRRPDLMLFEWQKMPNHYRWF